MLTVTIPVRNSGEWHAIASFLKDHGILGGATIRMDEPDSDADNESESTPKKTRKKTTRKKGGRKKKQPAEDDVDDVLGNSERAASKTYEDAVAAVRKASEEHGIPFVRQTLSEYNAKTVRDVDAGSYDDFIADLEGGP